MAEVCPSVTGASSVSTMADLPDPASTRSECPRSVVRALANDVSAAVSGDVFDTLCEAVFVALSQDAAAALSEDVTAALSAAVSVALSQDAFVALSKDVSAALGQDSSVALSSGAPAAVSQDVSTARFGRASAVASRDLSATLPGDASVSCEVGAPFTSRAPVAAGSCVAASMETIDLPGPESPGSAKTVSSSAAIDCRPAAPVTRVPLSSPVGTCCRRTEIAPA